MKFTVTEVTYYINSDRVIVGARHDLGVKPVEISQKALTKRAGGRSKPWGDEHVRAEVEGELKKTLKGAVTVALAAVK